MHSRRQLLVSVSKRCKILSAHDGVSGTLYEHAEKPEGQTPAERDGGAQILVAAYAYRLPSRW